MSELRYRVIIPLRPRAHLSEKDMSWDFEIFDMSIIGGFSVAERWDDDWRGSDIDPAHSDVPPPWEALDGFAEADNGRRYSWQISTLGRYLDPSSWEPGETVERYDRLPLPGATGLYVTAGEVPLVLVDGRFFGAHLVDLLQDGPPELRPRWLWPELTQDEQDWLDELEAADERHQVPLAIATLAAVFGEPVRIEAGQAPAAAAVLAEAGYVISPEPLFRTHRTSFSNRARQLMRSLLAEHQPR